MQIWILDIEFSILAMREVGDVFCFFLIEVIPSIEASFKALLEVDRLQSGPDLCRVILDSLNMSPLLCRK